MSFIKLTLANEGKKSFLYGKGFYTSSGETIYINSQLIEGIQCLNFPESQIPNDTINDETINKPENAIPGVPTIVCMLNGKKYIVCETPEKIVKLCE